MTTENSQTHNSNKKTAGILFLLAGVAFIVSYLFSRQTAFLGVGAAFFGVAGVYLAKSKKS